LVDDQQAFCSKCGNKMDGTGVAQGPYQQTQQVIYRPEKSENVAAVLSLFLLGVGNMYVGKVGRGVGILVLGIVISMVAWFFLIGEIVIIIYWIWNVYDAHKSAQEYNTYLRATGNPPW